MKTQLLTGTPASRLQRRFMRNGWSVSCNFTLFRGSVFASVKNGNTKLHEGTRKKRYLCYSSLLAKFAFLLLVLSLSCSSKPVDVRTLAPADALVYLEANDLGKTLNAITSRPAFKQLVKAEPDFSALGGMRLAVAVTGFETSEQAVTDENSILNFQPRFVAIIETNAWSWQTKSFVEHKLGEFINEAYGGEVELEVSPKNEGSYYVWTSADGQAYALVSGSIIFFGNDETAIEKCMAVRRGEAESIAKNPQIKSAPDSLAFGFVSPDGIALIANLAGIQLAMQTSEEGAVKSFIARVLPEILRGFVQEIEWSAAATDKGIEDRFRIRTKTDISQVLNETLAPSSEAAPNFSEYIPAEAVSFTRYDLKDPQIAWRSIVLTSQKQTDPVSGTLIAAFSDSLFEPYGIENAELFLSSIGPRFVTVRFDVGGESVAAIASVKKIEDLKKSLAKEIKFDRPAEKIGDADVWRSDDASAVFIDGKVILGDTENVLQCLNSKQSGRRMQRPFFQEFTDSKTVSSTLSTDVESAAKIVEILAEKKNENENLPIYFLTETRFNQHGIERRTVSDFGLLGLIIEQLEKE